MTEGKTLRPAPPCTVVIFGAAGDLTKRKLFPALYNLKANRLLPRELAIIGVARKPLAHEEFRREQTEDINQFATRKVDDPLWGRLKGLVYDVLAHLQPLLPQNAGQPLLRTARCCNCHHVPIPW